MLGLQFKLGFHAHFIHATLIGVILSSEKMGLHLQLYIKSTPMLIPTTFEIWWVHNHQIQE